MAERDPFEALRRNVSTLGHALGATLVEQEGQAATAGTVEKAGPA